MPSVDPRWESVRDGTLSRKFIDWFNYESNENALQLSAKTLSKPEAYIVINVRHNPTLTFAGTFDPAFIFEIVSCPFHSVIGLITTYNNRLVSGISVLRKMLSIVKCSFRISRKGLGSRMIGDTCMCDRSSWFYRFAIWCFVHSTFTDPGNAYIGYKGTTFETIIGKWSASLSTQEKKMTMYYYRSSSKRHVWLYNAKLTSSNFSKKTEWACDWDE